MSTLSQTLVKLRKERGWSQEKLAAISGISERTIQRIENNGTCALETKMALANALDIPPAELQSSEEQKISSVEMKTDWGGAIGLFVFGIAAPLIVILTSTNGLWELVSFTLVIGLTIVMSLMSYGARDTYQLLNNTSWLVRYPNYVAGLNGYITQCKAMIENTYIMGIVASLVTVLTLTIHGSEPIENIRGYLAISVKPLIYAVLFTEFWFRPYKRKLEKMLANQLDSHANTTT